MAQNGDTEPRATQRTPAEEPIASGSSEAIAAGSERPLQELPPSAFDRESFLSLCGISEEELSSTDLRWEELSAIYSDYLARRDGLEVTASYVAERLRHVDSAHSVRVRIKDGAHLIRKILRKRRENPQRDITFQNYRMEVTDLVGIRVLHLSKDEWQPIHEFIRSEWDIVEGPLAYVREGDHPAWVEAYKNSGCNVEVHPRQYRSIHYVIESAPSRIPTRVEIQVRTIFEEAWSETDHRINYPRPAPASVGVFLGVLNRLAGSADEMVSFIYGLATEMNAQSEAFTTALSERDAALGRVEELISKLKIGEKERRQLAEQLDQVRERTTTSVRMHKPGVTTDYFANISGPFTLPPTPTSMIVTSGLEDPGFTTSAFSYLAGPRCKHCARSLVGRSKQEQQAGLCSTCSPSTSVSWGDLPR